MSKKQPFDRPAVYRIRVKGQLDAYWSDWLEGLNIAPQAAGETLLCGLVTDQAALYGLLKKVRDMGLGLISVDRVQCDYEQISKKPGEERYACSNCRLTGTQVDESNQEVGV